MTDASQAPQPRRASYVLHVASVAGFDREGFAPFPVGQLELVRMLDQVLDLFDNEPRFQQFTLDGQSILLEDYLSIRPENFERIEQAVRDGKLLVGPWYVQPAHISIELLIRNLMIGLRTARVFGRPMLAGYMPGITALPAFVPQILKGFGINSVMLSFGDDHQPIERTWIGDDSNPITVCDLRRELALGEDGSISSVRQSLAPYSASGHLLLPTRGYEQTNSRFSTGYPDDIFCSSPAAYAQAVETHARRSPLPVVDGDLGRWQSGTKPRTCQAERLLTQLIEPFSVWAAEHADCPFIDQSQQLIQRLWRDILTNQRKVLNAPAEQEAVNMRFNHVERFAEHIKGLQPDIDSDSLGPRLVQASDSVFYISAVKLPEEADRSGMIVRGYNTTDEPIWLTLTPWRPFATVDVVTLDEVPTGGKLAAESNGAIRFKAAPHRILTFWFHD